MELDSFSKDKKQEKWRQRKWTQKAQDHMLFSAS